MLGVGGVGVAGWWVLGLFTIRLLACAVPGVGEGIRASIRGVTEGVMRWEEVGVVTSRRG